MRKFIFYLAMAALTSTFAACDKNDDGDDKEIVNIENLLYTGTLTVVQSDGSKYVQDSTQVIIKQIDTENIEMQMLKVKFSNFMPLTLDMTVPGINYEKVGSKYSLSGSNIIPLAMGGEFPAYLITDISGSFDGDEFSISFDCGGYPLTYTGSI